MHIWLKSMISQTHTRHIKAFSAKSNKSGSRDIWAPMFTFGWFLTDVLHRNGNENLRRSAREISTKTCRYVNKSAFKRRHQTWNFQPMRTWLWCYGETLEIYIFSVLFIRLEKVQVERSLVFVCVNHFGYGSILIWRSSAIWTRARPKEERRLHWRINMSCVLREILLLPLRLLCVPLK